MAHKESLSLTPCASFLPGKSYGADDFLPVLMYVLARSNLTEMLLNVEYMMELMDPALQLGEGESPVPAHLRATGAHHTPPHPATPGARWAAQCEPPGCQTPLSPGNTTQGPTQALSWGSSQMSSRSRPVETVCHHCLTCAEMVGSPEGRGACYPDWAVREGFWRR